MIAKKKIIISLHGIRTRGTWQKELCPYFSEQGWKYYALDFGYFTAAQLLIPFCHSSKAAWFRAEVNRIADSNQGIRPSVVVHSFGSLILALALERYQDLKFDKIVLTGSIIHSEFSWSKVFERGQCSAVLNLIGEKDPWVRCAQYLVWNAGWSGAKGFRENSLIEEHRYEKFDHGDAHSHEVIHSRILPFLAKPTNFADGTPSQNYLALVSPFEAACWAAITYQRQFIDRFLDAIRDGQFFDRSGTDAPLEKLPVSLTVLIPDDPAAASKNGRAALTQKLGMREVAFGTRRERTALQHDEGALYDLPSIIETFQVFREVHGDLQAALDCVASFEAVLKALIEGKGGDLACPVHLLRLSDLIRNGDKL